MVREFFFKAAFYVWLMLILVFSVIPNDAETHELFLFDFSGTGILKHILAYFIASFLLVLACKNETLRFYYQSLVVIFAGSVLIEFIQYLLPYRSFSLGDMLANFIGIILFFLPYWSYFVMRKGSVSPVTTK